MNHTARARRTAIVVSHPIQHFVPFFRALAQRPELAVKVFFGSRLGLDEYLDEGFGVKVKWDRDMLSGFDSEFLPGGETARDTGFFSIDSWAMKTMGWPFSNGHDGSSSTQTGGSVIHTNSLCSRSSSHFLRSVGLPAST